MPEVVSICFREAGPSYYFDPAGVEFAVGDWVVVETARGLSIGRVMKSPEQVPDKEVEEPLKLVKRKAGEEELAKYEELRAKEGEVMSRSAELVARHKLPMKLVAAEYNFDGSHLTIFFSAEGKVDFRALLKEMGSNFKTRVELRQIGARDVAKTLGGVGRCGRVLCCATFLNRFVPISVRMARDQSLPLNPATISGSCGKLLCCLKYEHDQYVRMKADNPSPGNTVKTPRGNGRVTSVSHLKGVAMVQLENEMVVEFPMADLKVLEGGKPGKNARK